MRSFRLMVATVFIWWEDWCYLFPDRITVLFVKSSDIFHLAERGQAPVWLRWYLTSMIQDLILAWLTTSLAYNSKYSKLNRLNGIEWIFNLQTLMFYYKNGLKIIITCRRIKENISLQTSQRSIHFQDLHIRFVYSLSQCIL